MYRARLKELRLRNTPDLPTMARALEDFFNHEVRKEFITVQKETQVTTEQFTTAVTAVTGPPGGASTINNYTISAAVQVASVVLGSQTITFSPSQSAANWIPLCCYMISSNGSKVDLTDAITNQTINSFDITMPEAGTLFFSPAPRV